MHKEAKFRWMYNKKIYYVQNMQTFECTRYFCFLVFYIFSIRSWSSWGLILCIFLPEFFLARRHVNHVSLSPLLTLPYVWMSPCVSVLPLLMFSLYISWLYVRLILWSCLDSDLRGATAQMPLLLPQLHTSRRHVLH